MTVMTIDELKEKFKSDDMYGERVLAEDIIYDAHCPQGIDFDMENVDFDWPERLKAVVGWHLTPSGVPFLGAYVGGDWEHPLVFIVYWNESKQMPMMYVPKRGNVVDWERKQAYWIEEVQWDNEFGGRAKPDDVDFNEGELLADIAAFLETGGYKQDERDD